MNRFGTAYPQLESMFDDDISEACSGCEARWGLAVDLIGLDINQINQEYDTSVTYEVIATMVCEGLEFSIKFEFIDDVDSDMYELPEITMYDIHDAYQHRYYMSMNQKFDAKDFEDRLNQRGNVSIVSSTSIMAAEDDDPFSDMGFDESEGDDATISVDDDESVEDNLDDMADTLDDINDALEDFEEDDIDIETENNISDHYIAECEKCHGVFIASVIESDQEIEKISGTCPLCDEECDQYLKWVIKEL